MKKKELIEDIKQRLEASLVEEAETLLTGKSLSFQEISLSDARMNIEGNNLTLFLCTKLRFRLLNKGGDAMV